VKDGIASSRGQSGQMKDAREEFRPASGEVPTNPGVYRFSDRNGRVLYIGKAKNLRSRIANYFGPLNALNPKTQRMLALSSAIDWTVVATDTEALILERSWIREMKPPFNIQFRDDKSYPFIAVTLASDAPRLIITRNRNIRGARYFGPFPKLWAVKETASLLQSAFPMRTCDDATYKRAIASDTACFASQIGRCKGPCSLAVTLEDHREHVNALVAFLSGHDSEQLRKLKAAMKIASAQQDYELAAKLRDQVEAAEHVLERNTIVLRESVNADVFGLEAGELSAAAHQFIVRNGRIRGERSWVVDVDEDATTADLIATVIRDAYVDSDVAETDLATKDSDGSASAVPSEIIVSVLPRDHEALERVLESVRGSAVKIHTPSKGEKRHVTDRALSNAQEHLQRYKLKRSADIVTRTDALAELQTAFEMPEPPLRIECIDISHLSGADVVGSLVAFDDALPAKSGYRQYRIANTTDDTDSIHQVVTRRFASLASSEHQNLAPQLLLVDGGLPQVNAAARALDELGFTAVTVRGVAKRLEEIWAPSSQFPYILPRSSEALFLLQRIRDEAHRFAINFQRKRRSTHIASQLGEIPGLGEKRVRSLLRAFKSLKRIQSASIDELASVDGISVTLARQISDYFAGSPDQE
jgi:excinuclease ABC subunit C